MTLQSNLNWYRCRLELVLSGEGIKQSLGKHYLDRKLIEDFELYLLTHGHLNIKSELAFDCRKGRRNYGSDYKELPDDRARFVFKLTIVDKEVFAGSTE